MSGMTVANMVEAVGGHGKQPEASKQVRLDFLQLPAMYQARGMG